jgi:hypothetical protein
MSIESLDRRATSSEQFFIAWLKPLGLTKLRVNDDTPLPVRRVQEIFAVDDSNLFYTTAQVAVFTMCNYSADGDNWEIDAEAASQDTHDRILYLAQHEVTVELPDGRKTDVDYLTVTQSPIWIDYENDQMLVKEARYEVGLQFVAVT